jgi:DNA mismatch repair protein MutS
MTQEMQKQFHNLKKKHPDALLLFRCGDFYESYEEDAKVCAKVLGITLTKHSDGHNLAAFPYHALDSYLPRLIRAGRRLAICDQLEDPRLTKKLVKRGITELKEAAV